MTDKINQIDATRIPAHVAVIMDGNGRWAKQRGNARAAGHLAGVESVRTVIKAASEIGISYLTLYTFSTENWNRPKEEVDMLLTLIVDVLARETDDLRANNVRLTMIGDIDRLPEGARESLLESMRRTAGSTGLTVVLALSYSSKWEIVEAVRKIASQSAAGTLEPSSIDESTIDSALATSGIPHPDILIRTGGDLRISNFLLWQIAYSELYFTDIFWPEFGREQFFDAIIDYQSRERRFGKTSEQIKNSI